MDFQKVQNINCWLCNADNADELANKTQFNMPYKTVICKECGLVYLNPVPIKEELNTFYKNEYINYYGIPSCSKTRGYEIYNFIKSYVKNVNNILEIGAGGGWNLTGLSEKYQNKNLFAFEPGGTSNTKLKHNGIIVIGEFYDQEPVDLTKYDLIILSHVLEHFFNPKKVLKKIWNETSENVSLYISIPSLSAIDKSTYQYHSRLEDYWFRVVHLSYFHRKNIEDMLFITGWKITDSYEKGNGELLLLLKKNPVDKYNNFIPRNVYLEHKKEISFYKMMTEPTISQNLKRNNLRVILFGASQFGKKAMEIIRGNTTIVCFCDNDSNKWGNEINGIKIVSPEEIVNLEFDKVIITSDYYREIGIQLYNLGIVNVERLTI